MTENLAEPRPVDSGEFRTSDTLQAVDVSLISINRILRLLCSVVDEQFLFEGDIVIASRRETLGLTTAHPRFRWPSRTIVYHVARTLVRPERVAQAIQHLSDHTILRFRRRTDETDYVLFKNGPGCSSFVGKVGGVQFITLSPECAVGNAIHEIGHTAGLWHEHSRADRDDHVTINWDNIAPTYRHNFDQHISDGDDVGEYDYGSIMHYPSNAFALDGSMPTVLPKVAVLIGQRQRLSAGDIAAIVSIYP